MPLVVNIAPAGLAPGLSLGCKVFVRKDDFDCVLLYRQVSRAADLVDGLDPRVAAVGVRDLRKHAQAQPWG